MKHRTVTVFIVVLAALAAVPQAFEQLSSLRDAAGNRLTAGVWNVFLGLHGQKVGGAPRAQELPQAALLVRAEAPEGPASARAARRAVRPSKWLETASARPSAARPDAGLALEVLGKELAMLDGLHDLISVEMDSPEERILVRAPKPPSAVRAPVSPAASRVETLPVVFKFDTLLKSNKGLKQLHERVKGEYVRRAASAVGADDAATPHTADYVWKVEQNQTPGRAPSCDTGAEEFTY